MKKRLLFLLIFLIAAPGLLHAGSGQINFVETEVDLRADGSAVVAYTVQWQVMSGEMHGFYFEGIERLQISRFSSDSYAVDSGGNHYGLSISRVNSGKWDIILAGGQGVSFGTLTYVFYFETDFAAAGYVAETTSVAETTANDGLQLVVFNWAPVQWDEAHNQDHYTLTLLTPYELPVGQQPRQYVDDNQLVLTEKWVNERYKIDYQRSESKRLQVVFHRDRPGNMYHMETQIYLPAGWFDLAGLKAKFPEVQVLKREVQRQQHVVHQKELFLIGMLFLGGLFVIIVASKHKSMVSSHRGLDDVRWNTLDWTPPKLLLSTFRVPGKVCLFLTPL